MFTLQCLLIFLKNQNYSKTQFQSWMQSIFSGLVGISVHSEHVWTQLESRRANWWKQSKRSHLRSHSLYLLFWADNSNKPVVRKLLWWELMPTKRFANKKTNSWFLSLSEICLKFLSFCVILRVSKWAQNYHMI